MIALLIGYEAVSRFLAPIPIHFGEAIPIAVVGLLVNLASVWLLSGDHHGHSHGHNHGHGHGHDDHAHEGEAQKIVAPCGVFAVSIFEDGVPPVFRITQESPGSRMVASTMTITTFRPDGARQVFPMADRGQ
jgi:Co/Zn/Cd efflux system component